jgi:hypothetical protein
MLLNVINHKISTYLMQISYIKTIIVKNLISFQQCVRAIIIGVMTLRKQQKSLLELEKPAKL